MRTEQLAIDPARDKVNNSMYKRYFESISTKSGSIHREHNVWKHNSVTRYALFFEILKRVYKVSKNRDTQIKRMEHENTLSGNFIIFWIIHSLRFIHFRDIVLFLWTWDFSFSSFCMSRRNNFYKRRQMYEFSVDIFYPIFHNFAIIFFFLVLYQADFASRSLDARWKKLKL